jgi:hypothetical protein
MRGDAQHEAVTGRAPVPQLRQHRGAVWQLRGIKALALGKFAL